MRFRILIEMSEIATRNLPTSVRSKREISEHAQEHAPCFSTGVLDRDEDGMFVAECPTLPGCISQGKNRSEAIRNIKDAAKGYLESLKKHNEPIPPSIDEEVVEVYA